MKISNLVTWLVAGGALAVGLLSVELTVGPAPHAGATSSATNDVRAHAGREEGGGFDVRPRLTQASHFSGTTNTGRQPEVMFLARNVGPETVDAVAEQLRAKAVFVDAAGGRIPAKAQTEPSLGTSYTHAITLTPAQPLAADTWYTLTIERDPALVVGGPEDMLDDPDAAKQVRMFTGSAPQIRRITRGTDARKASQIDVVMSEPVELGELVRLGFQVQVGARPLAGCVAWDAGCVDTGATAKTNAFSFHPAMPLVIERPIDLVVAMSARVHGAARSVEEGAALTRMPLDASTGQRRHLVAVAAAQWNLCSDTGDVQCWRNTGP
jgi:hypothetical protein